MTDGVLLAEIGHDRDLRRYDTIIIDEAHERSLNIDFLLGYLSQLTARRPDLKIIITSATIDTERFAAHFAGPDGTPAPIIEVSGRTYPVEVRYRPLLTDGEADQVGGIVDAVTRAERRRRRRHPGLPVRGAGDPRRRRGAHRAASCATTEVLPLYARLVGRRAAPGVRRAHRPPGRAGHQRGRDLADRARASATWSTPAPRGSPATRPGPRCSGCPSSRSPRRRPTSGPAAAAGWRPGSASGCTARRTSLGRPEFTEPEILRTNLASVILQMTAAELGEIAAFPFVEAPDGTQITDGLRLLTELGALADQGLADPAAADRRSAAGSRPSRSIRGWAGCCWPPSARAACARC